MMRHTIEWKIQTSLDVIGKIKQLHLFEPYHPPAHKPRAQGINSENSACQAGIDQTPTKHVGTNEGRQHCDTIKNLTKINIYDADAQHS